MEEQLAAKIPRARWAGSLSNEFQVPQGKLEGISSRFRKKIPEEPWIVLLGVDDPNRRVTGTNQLSLLESKIPNLNCFKIAKQLWKKEFDHWTHSKDYRFVINFFQEVQPPNAINLSENNPEAFLRIFRLVWNLYSIGDACYNSLIERPVLSANFETWVQAGFACFIECLHDVACHSKNPSVLKDFSSQLRTLLDNEIDSASLLSSGEILEFLLRRYQVDLRGLVAETLGILIRKEALEDPFIEELTMSLVNKLPDFGDRVVFQLVRLVAVAPMQMFKHFDLLLNLIGEGENWSSKRFRDYFQIFHFFAKIYPVEVLDRLEEKFIRQNIFQMDLGTYSAEERIIVPFAEFLLSFSDSYRQKVAPFLLILLKCIFISNLDKDFQKHLAEAAKNVMESMSQEELCPYLGLLESLKRELDTAPVFKKLSPVTKKLQEIMQILTKTKAVEQEQEQKHREEHLKICKKELLGIQKSSSREFPSVSPEQMFRLVSDLSLAWRGSTKTETGSWKLQSGHMEHEFIKKEVIFPDRVEYEWNCAYALAKQFYSVQLVFHIKPSSSGSVVDVSTELKSYTCQNTEEAFLKGSLDEAALDQQLKHSGSAVLWPEWVLNEVEKGLLFFLQLETDSS